MTILLYFDEDSMRHALVQALRARGTDVVTALEAGMIERSDAEHLDYATAQERALSRRRSEQSPAQAGLCACCWCSFNCRPACPACRVGLYFRHNSIRELRRVYIMPTGKRHPEVEAVEAIHRALEPLDPEARARVLRSVTSLLEVTTLPTLDNRPTSANISPPSPTVGTGIQPQMSINAFIASKRPGNVYQRLACLAYFLEHHDQTVDVNAKDLATANSNARQANIPGTTNALSDATSKYEFFAPVGRGRKHLTSRGVAVVEALPDQEAVKRALQQHPSPRRSGRRTRAKRAK